MRKPLVWSCCQLRQLEMGILGLGNTCNCYHHRRNHVHTPIGGDSEFSTFFGQVCRLDWRCPHHSRADVSSLCVDRRQRRWLVYSLDPHAHCDFLSPYLHLCCLAVVPRESYRSCTTIEDLHIQEYSLLRRDDPHGLVLRHF